MRDLPDPRFPGGVYYSDYWQDWYTVLDIEFEHTPGYSCLKSVTMAWSNGRVVEHCTSFGTRDRILCDPRPAAAIEAYDAMREPHASVAMPKVPRKSARRLAADVLLDAGIDRDEVQELLGD